MLAGALVRKASADALHQSQARYKLATVSGRVIVWDWDLETSNFYFDPFLKSLLGYEDREIGEHFDDWLRLIHPEDVDLVLARFHDHIHSGALRFEVEHRLLQKDGGIRWFLASGTVIENDQGARVRIVGTNTDITERKLAAQEMQNLSTRLMDLQDQERRRIARELHDGTAQNLLLISLDLQALKLKFPGTLEEEFSECQTLCEQSLQEIRTLSYVLHPPMLDEGGLLAALRWYLAGFSKRSGIDVDLVAQEIGRLPQAIEMDMFRIVQECLSNIHRPARASGRDERGTLEALIAAFGAAIALSIPRTAEAQIDWNLAIGGEWTTGANWVGGVAPASVVHGQPHEVEPPAGHPLEVALLVRSVRTVPPEDELLEKIEATPAGELLGGGFGQS
jgi:two-component system sensor histidine kinase UhpB